MAIHIKRIYEEPAPSDGYRVLVDRLWPRGITKERAALDLWGKEVAPSNRLRTWYHHTTGQFDEFARRYQAELDDNPAVDTLRRALQDHTTVTLLFAAKDENVNHAVILARYLAT